MQVNGHELVGQRRLKDGDFIHNRKEKAIFQADPVADYRREWDSPDAKHSTTIQPTQRLTQHVVINSDGMSLDSGKSFAHWSEINGLFVYWEHTSSNWSIQVKATSSTAKKGVMSSKFRASVLGAKEIDTILEWVYYTAPVHVSIQSFSMAQFPDAYVILAHEKVLKTSSGKTRLLPASPAFILGLATRRRLISNIVIRLFGSAIVAFLIAAAVRLGNPALFTPVFIVSYAFFVVRLSKGLIDELHYLRKLHEYESLEWKPEIGS